MLGNNMFAYCLNNPIVFKDTWGTIPVPALFDYYWMHKAVQIDIVENYGFGMEVFVIGEKGIGYLEIYDGELNEYYEVKHILAAQGKLYNDQMKKYDHSHVAGWRFTEYDIQDNVSKGSEDSSGSTTYLYWDIVYYTKCEGVIIYGWILNANRYQEFVAVSVTVGAAVLCCYAMGGALATERTMKKWESN